MESNNTCAILGPSNQIACYSVTAEGIEYNTASLRYFVPPPLGTDFNDGCQAFKRLHKHETHCPQRLDNALFTCLQPEAKGHLLKSDVVLRRGVLVRIMLGMKVALNVSLINKVLFIEEYEPDPRAAYFFPESFYGLAFESSCTTSLPPTSHFKQSSPNKLNVDPDTKWLTVISRKLGDLNLLLSGEVDCVKGQYTGQPDTFLELKLRKINSKPHGDLAWYRKAYLQSHLIGVPELLVGRHADGILCMTERLHVADIPSKVITYGRSWDPQREIDRGYIVLATIRRLCLEEVVQHHESHNLSNERVWRVEVRGSYGSRPEVNVRELTVDEIVGLSSEDDGERVGIVPLRVANEFRRMQEAQ